MTSWQGLEKSYLEIFLVLVSRAKKIKNYFYRIKCCKRNLNEKSVPIAHCTIPKTWKLECLEFAALVAL